MADEQMPKLHEQNKTRKLTLVEQEFMHLIEKQNAARVVKFQRAKRNNRITGLLLGAGVLSIYGYTIWAVRQESFLDDFDEPEKTTE